MLSPQVRWLAASAAIVTGLSAGVADAQFQPPANSLALDDQGTLEGMQGNQLKFRDSKQEVWVLTVNAQSSVSIEGLADVSYLRPGMTVEFTGTINEDADVAEPLSEIEVVTSKSRLPMGLFNPSEASDDAKPERNPTAGEYRVRGRVASIKEGKLEVAAGRLKIGAQAGDDMKVVLAVDDPRLAQFGDTMKVKAWYYDLSKPIAVLNKPGQALAEEVHITLSAPPTTGKRGR